MFKKENIILKTFHVYSYVDFIQSYVNVTGDLYLANNREHK